jgi:anti-sigma regulatory factor (Ser/Thr protein kinase)
VTDTVTLTIPREPRFFGVARLVVGGLAARLELPYDALEDLQLALDGVLANEAYAAGDEVTIALTLAGELVEIALGPVDGSQVRADLAADDEGIGLRRLLGTVVERAEVEERDGADWVRLEKRITRGGVAA